MNIEDLATLRDNMREQYLWTAAHESRFAKDQPVLILGNDIGQTGEDFWKRAASMLGVALQMNQFFTLLAEDGDNAHLLINLMHNAAKATRSIRHLTAGEWVEDGERLMCPVCNESISAADIMMLSTQDWFAEEASEDDSPQLQFAPYRYGTYTLPIVMMHDRNDSSIARCLFNVESATFGLYPGAGEESIGQ